MDDLLREFLTETGENLELVDAELVRFEQEPNNVKILENIFRLVHTIKGTCGFLKLPRLEALTHAAETLMSTFRSGKPVTADAVSLVLATLDRIKALLDQLGRNEAEPLGHDRDLIARLHAMASADICTGSAVLGAAECQISPPHLAGSAPSSLQPGATGSGSRASMAAEEDRSETKIASSSIRVHVTALDHLMTMVSELVLTRNQLIEIVRRQQESEFKGPLQRLSHITAELQEGVLKTRMQPIGIAWQKLPRIVRDLSAELNKPVEIEMLGADTELDRQVIELIKDPLTHMVRNAADHGIEVPKERVAAGKPERGLIKLTASHEGGHILIEVADDGRGLDVARIRGRAVALGLGTESEIAKLTDTQAARFIFAAGLSTADRITSISGRGIGMDVVRANLDKIGGSIDVSSVRGRGTAFTIKIPLTLSIVPALIIEVGAERFAVPQLAVVELVRVRSSSELSIEHIKEAPVLRLRNNLLALVDLKTLLHIDNRAEAKTEGTFVVVLQVAGQSFGVVVDAVFDTEEIVVKPLSSRLRQIAMFSGNTILGDGSVVLILDPNGIARQIGIADGKRQSRTEDRPPEDRAAPLESILVFRAGTSNPKAVPLSLVTRLEEIDARTIEVSNGRHVVQYRGQLMPLVPVSADVKIRDTGMQPLLVFADDRRALALVVDEIIDIVEDRFDFKLTSDTPGLLGSAVIKGRATEIIDLSHFPPLAFDDWRDWKERTTDGPARTVLLVDDAEFFRNMLAPVLRAAGYAVTAAASASEALALLDADQAFDCLITDIDMPGMSGFELATVVRSNPRTAEVPIIGLASIVSPEAVERGKHAGLLDCVTKFDRRRLIAALKNQVAA